jgi:AraC-like DNA-binding protein
MRSPPVLAARTISKLPVSFARLSLSGALPGPSLDVPREDAFTVMVSLRPIGPTDFWIDGRHRSIAGAPAGSAFLFDLRENPRTQLHDSFDLVRFHMSRQSLDELAYGLDMHHAETLRQPAFGAADTVMHGLAMALCVSFEQPTHASALFIDHIALAFHIHLLRAYGRSVDPIRNRATKLSPGQLRRACDALIANLDGDPTVEQISRQCDLSPSHFARAFKHSTGLPPHRWLTRKRVDKAMQMLATGSLSLADVALACGFADQSHFTRSFVRLEGRTPGRWRRLKQL